MTWGGVGSVLSPPGRVPASKFGGNFTQNLAYRTTTEHFWWMKNAIRFIMPLGGALSDDAV